MKWIKYEYVCGTDSDGGEILAKKRVGYNESNLAIAEAEAYNGEYTIEDDGQTDSGESNLTGDVSMGGHKITNLGDAENDSDAPNFGQVKKLAEDMIPVKGVDYYTEQERNALISELSQIEAPKIVESVDEMTDTSKHYVNQNTGTIWAYIKHIKSQEGSVVPNFTNVFDADSAMIGYRWSKSSGGPVAAAHCILSDFIPCDLSSGEHTIRIKNGRLDWKYSNAGIMYFSSNSSDAGIDSAFSLESTPTEESDGVLAYKLGEKNGSMISGYANTRYIRCIAVQVPDGVNILATQTAENAKGIIITIDEPITYTEIPESTETYYAWTDTGITYAPTFKTDLIGVLGENNVIYLSDTLPSGTYTLKYPDDDYAVVGTISK